VFLLVPWDFVPEADWRSGVPVQVPDRSQVQERAEAFGSSLKQRSNARFLFLPAPLPPVLAHPRDDIELAGRIGDLASSLGAFFLPREIFSLTAYLGSGCPIASSSLGGVAEQVVARALSAKPEACKVLITDLDNVLWAGGIAEDGLEGIAFAPEGLGYRHFLYQSYLLRLKAQGVLLAAVSRNDRQDALAPLKTGRMLLREEDFVGVFAGYQAKSAQIREIAKQLNLGLDSFVFVDDNPVELAEVSARLPEVRCLKFPAEEGLASLFECLAGLTAGTPVTAEDRERTELYRRRLRSLPPAHAEGADLTEFLRGLGMTLTLHSPAAGNRARLVQLINKTKQFNLNGRRVSD
ncbi:MAG: HAD-IIIC family phosphatase, partial [Terriglobales bacterium]